MGRITLIKFFKDTGQGFFRDPRAVVCDLGPRKGAVVFETDTQQTAVV